MYDFMLGMLIASGLLFVICMITDEENLAFLGLIGIVVFFFGMLITYEASNKFTTEEQVLYDTLAYIYDDGRMVDIYHSDFKEFIVGLREDKIVVNTMPFCDVGDQVIMYDKALPSNKQKGMTLTKFLPDNYPRWISECIKDVTIEGPAEVKPDNQATLTVDPLTTATLKALTATAKDCNIAKVKAISGDIKSLTETYALELIRDCEVFKLQKELQR